MNSVQVHSSRGASNGVTGRTALCRRTGREGFSSVQKNNNRSRRQVTP